MDTITRNLAICSVDSLQLISDTPATVYSSSTYPIRLLIQNFPSDPLFGPLLWDIPVKDNITVVMTWVENI